MIDEQDIDDDMDELVPTWLGPDGLRIMEDQCSTCIFKSGNLMRLTRGRVKQMTDVTDAGDTNVVCHQTLSDDLTAMCRGSYDRRPGQLARIAERVNFIEWVELEP